MDRRSVIYRLAATSIASVVAGAERAQAGISGNMLGGARNVRDFGAVGDGETDDTEAFNRATQADVAWSWGMLQSIVIPAGRYRVAGTVYLRKGQTLIGDGQSTYIDASGAKRSTFIMGRRRGGDRGVVDPGGLPVRIQGLMGLGGAPSEGFIFAAIPGFQINSLFLSATGLGIEIEGADGIISDVEIDQCLTAVLLRNSQNIVITNLNIYLANYGVTFLSNCCDISITNALLCYTKYAGILLGDGASNINNIAISSSIFTNNVPYKTFVGYIYSRASNSDVLVSNCSFRNAPDFAVHQGAGIGFSITLQGCLFDGRRSNPGYNQSLESKGIKTGFGTFIVTNCSFRRLSGEVFRLGAGLAGLTIDGGSIVEVAGERIVADSALTANVTVSGVIGLERVSADVRGAVIHLPSIGMPMIWRLGIRSNDPSAAISGAEIAAVVDRNGAAQVSAIWQVHRVSGSPESPAEAPRSVPVSAGLGAAILLPSAMVGATEPTVALSTFP